MNLAELMQDTAPSASLAGIATADDFVFALDFENNPDADPNTYLVAQEGLTEVSGAMSTQTQSNTYLRAGEVTTVTGHSKAFSLSGDRYRNDPFQEAILAHALKWGTGTSVIRPYVYFDMLTGKGEKGRVAISIEGDFANGAGGNAGISATFNVQGKPAEYTYTPPAG